MRGAWEEEVGGREGGERGDVGVGREGESGTRSRAHASGLVYDFSKTRS